MIDDLLLKVPLKSRRLLVVLVPLVGGLFAGWIVVIKPGLSQLAVAKAELGSLSQKESSFGFIANSEKKLGDYKQKLSKTGDKTWLVDELNSIADKSKLSILSITPDEKKTMPGGYLENISVRIEAEGNYHQLGEFVSHVESLEQFIKISTLSIDAPGPGGGTDGPASSRARAGFYKILLSVSLFNPVAGAL